MSTVTLPRKFARARGWLCRIGGNADGPEEDARVHLESTAQPGDLRLAGLFSFAAEQFGGRALASQQAAQLRYRHSRLLHQHAQSIGWRDLMHIDPRMFDVM